MFSPGVSQLAARIRDRLHPSSIGATTTFPPPLSPVRPLTDTGGVFGDVGEAREPGTPNLIYKFVLVDSLRVCGGLVGNGEKVCIKDGEDCGVKNHKSRKVKWPSSGSVGCVCRLDRASVRAEDTSSTQESTNQGKFQAVRDLLIPASIIPSEVCEEWVGGVYCLSDWQKRFTAVQVAAASNEEKLPSAGDVLQAALNMKAAATLKTPGKRSSDDFYSKAGWSFSPYEAKLPTDGASYLPDAEEIASVVAAMDLSLADTSALLTSSNEHARLKFEMMGQQIHQVFGGMADLRSIFWEFKSLQASYQQPRSGVLSAPWMLGQWSDLRQPPPMMTRAIYWRTG